MEAVFNPQEERVFERDATDYSIYSVNHGGRSTRTKRYHLSGTTSTIPLSLHPCTVNLITPTVLHLTGYRTPSLPPSPRTSEPTMISHLESLSPHMAWPFQHVFLPIDGGLSLVLSIINGNIWFMRMAHFYRNVRRVQRHIRSHFTLGRMFPWPFTVSEPV